MIQPLVYSDFYKTGHKDQYPEGTELVYSNFTPRSSRMKGVNEVVVFGIQYFIKEYLINRFNEEFFNKPKEEILANYKRRLDNSLGPNAVNIDHMGALHDLGYLPIKIKALPEGTTCPIQVPLMTIRNTKKDFFWLTNFLESILSTVIWQPITSATIAHEYRKLLDNYAKNTSDIPEFVDWQGHDFSFRGMSSFESACVSGGAHLLSFTGTDTIPAIDFLEKYYNANSDTELVGGSVPATEHSVMCMGSKETEVETFRRLINKVYPTGVVSIVSDTWDYWKVLTEYLPILKDEIIERDGKVVIRPDSGDPVKIICGDCGDSRDYANKGSIEVLWDLFGGTVNSKGYKQLDPHIGLIYGDSITLERATQIVSQLEAKGFASTNVVFGVGSYTYQYNTRDTFGFAMKATFGKINGEEVDIYKDPKTDTDFKKSAMGLLSVSKDKKLIQGVSWDEEKYGLLKTVFFDGKITKDFSLEEIRQNIKNN